MTDQTVPVPVDLLKRLFDNTTLTRDVFAGDSVDVRPSGVGALIDIKALVPETPKVGDTLTAETIAALPRKATIRDADGDVWLVLDDGKVGFVDWIDLDPEAPGNLLAYGPATLVSLPRD